MIPPVRCLDPCAQVFVRHKCAWETAVWMHTSFRVRVQGLGLQVRVQGLGLQLRVQGLGLQFRVQGLGLQLRV